MFLAPCSTARGFIPPYNYFSNENANTRQMKKVIDSPRVRDEKNNLMTFKHIEIVFVHSQKDKYLDE